MPRTYTSSAITPEALARLKELQREFERRTGHAIAAYSFTAAMVDFCGDNIDALAAHFVAKMQHRIGTVNISETP